MQITITQRKKILLYYDEKDLFEYYTNNFKMALNILISIISFFNYFLKIKVNLMHPLRQITI